MNGKPYSAACDRNREPILAVLREHFADRRQVLEVGSGTGQHAVYFAASLPHLTWQTSDVAENLPGIRLWLDDARLPNLPPPLALDVDDDWDPVLRLKTGSGIDTSANAVAGDAGRFDAVFSANTLHIMSWPEVERLFAQLDAIATASFKLAIYGPFNYGGRFTSESNAAFDAALKARAPHMGIRDFEAVDALARSRGLRLRADVAMPANNRTLVWTRAAHA